MSVRFASTSITPFDPRENPLSRRAMAKCKNYRKCGRRVPVFMGPYARFCTPCSLANAGRRVPDEGYRPKLKRNPGNRTKGKVKRDAGVLGGKQSSRRNFNAWKKAFVEKKKWLDRILAPRRSIRQCKNHKKCGRRARSVRAIFCTPCFLANAKKMGREGGLATKGKLKRKLKAKKRFE